VRRLARLGCREPRPLVGAQRLELAASLGEQGVDLVLLRRDLRERAADDRGLRLVRRLRDRDGVPGGGRVGELLGLVARQRVEQVGLVEEALRVVGDAEDVLVEPAAAVRGVGGRRDPVLDRGEPRLLAAELTSRDRALALEGGQPLARRVEGLGDPLGALVERVDAGLDLAVRATRGTRAVRTRARRRA
jgi:hypothetical protein